MSADLEVKGHFLVAGREWVISRWGEEGYGKFLDALKPETRKLCESVILSSAWYHHSLWADFGITLDRVFGVGDGALIWEGGRQHARLQIRGLYAIVFKVISPEFLLKKHVQLFSLNFRPGHATMDMRNKECVFHFFGFNVQEKFFPIFQGTAGYLEESVSAAGGRDVEVKVLHPTRGDDWTVGFKIRWR